MANNTNGNNVENEFMNGEQGDYGRIKYVERYEGNAAFPNDDQMLTLNIQSTIVDRYAGTVVTEAIWRDEPNQPVIMRRAADARVRDVCARFFQSRLTRKVVMAAMSQRTIKPGEAYIVQADVFNEIGKVVEDANAQTVIMEILNSFLIRCSVVAKAGDFTTRTYYPFMPVTTATLASDVAMQEVVRVLNNAQIVNLEKRKYSNASFAEEVAEALYPVGRAMLEVNDLGGIIEDLVKGVRGNIDPMLTGLTGAVSSDWTNNSVIDELSRNYIFVNAALSLPVNSSVSPVNDGWKLSKWAPVVLAALKTSPRYAIVGKTEVLRTMGLKKVRDLRERPVSYVLWRSAKPDAVAQAVYAYEDAVIPGAMTVSPTKERVAESIAHAYGDVKRLSTDEASETLVRFLQHAVENGYTNSRLGYHVDLGQYHFASNHEVACLVAERVRVMIDPDNGVQAAGQEGAFDEPSWWYNVPTKERDFTFGISGKLDRETFLTNRIGEVFLAADEFEPAASVEPRPQLLAPVSFNSRIIGFDPNVLIEANKARYSYSVRINGVDVHGAFRASDLGAMRAASNTSLVVPAFNEEVFRAVGNVFFAISDELQRVEKQYTEEGVSKEMMGFLRRVQARHLLNYAQALSPSFRQEVHNGMIERAVRKLNPEEAIALRARLAQRSFGGYADISALLLFLTIQGLSNEAWESYAKDTDMMSAFIEYGSDRSAITRN